jgi:uncharacterized membrane protein
VRDRRGIVIAIVFAACCFTVGWLRHLHFWSGAFDLGLFDQGIWLLSRGRAPEISLLQRNLFSDHLSPVLVLFAAPYALVATPAWLLAAQALCLGVTVLPLRALAIEEKVPRGLVTVAVVLSAPLAAAAVFDFHPSTLATPFVAYTLLGARRGDRRLTTIAALAVVLCRADLGWVLVGIALVAQPNVRTRLLVIGPLSVLAGVVVPELLGNPGTWDPYYGHLGTGPVDALVHPWRMVRALVSEDAFRTLIYWLLPVGFLALLQPRWALALVVAGLPLLLSRWAGTHLPWFHYGAPFMPLAIGGALAAINSERVPRASSAVLLVGGSVAATLIAGPLSPNAPASVRLWEVVRAQPGAYEALVDSVPAGAPVAAFNQPLAHLMRRRDAYLFPLPFREPSDTYPAGLAPPPSSKDADAVRIVIVPQRDESLVRKLGFDQITRVRGGVVLARR